MLFLTCIYSQVLFAQSNFEIVIQKPHLNDIDQVCLSKDNRLAYSNSSKEKTVKIWDLHSNSILKSISTNLPESKIYLNHKFNVFLVYTSRVIQIYSEIGILLNSINSRKDARVILNKNQDRILRFTEKEIEILELNNGNRIGQIDFRPGDQSYHKNILSTLEENEFVGIYNKPLQSIFYYDIKNGKCYDSLKIKIPRFPEYTNIEPQNCLSQKLKMFVCPFKYFIILGKNNIDTLFYSNKYIEPFFLKTQKQFFLEDSTGFSIYDYSSEVKVTFVKHINIKNGITYFSEINDTIYKVVLETEQTLLFSTISSQPLQEISAEAKLALDFKNRIYGNNCIYFCDNKYSKVNTLCELNLDSKKIKEFSLSPIYHVNHIELINSNLISISGNDENNFPIVIFRKIDRPNLDYLKLNLLPHNTSEKYVQTMTLSKDKRLILNYKNYLKIFNSNGSIDILDTNFRFLGKMNNKLIIAFEDSTVKAYGLNTERIGFYDIVNNKLSFISKHNFETNYWITDAKMINENKILLRTIVNDSAWIWTLNTDSIISVQDDDVNESMNVNLRVTNDNPMLSCFVKDKSIRIRIKNDSNILGYDSIFATIDYFVTNQNITIKYLASNYILAFSTAQYVIYEKKNNIWEKLASKGFFETSYLKFIQFDYIKNRLIYSTSDNQIHTIELNGINDITLKLNLLSACNSFEIDSFYNHLIVSQEGGVLSFYNLETLANLFNIISNNESWLMFADNYYCTSGKFNFPIRFVSWPNAISINQFELRNNRPDLLIQKIGSIYGRVNSNLVDMYNRVYKKRLKRYNINENSLSNNASPPECIISNESDIGFEVTENKLILNLHFNDKSTYLKQFNIWVNECGVFSNFGINLEPRKLFSFDTSISLKLSYGANAIVTSVTNIDDIESFRKPLVINCLTKGTMPEKVYFVGIGIDKFKQNQNNLHYCEKDIKDLAKSLKRKFGDNLIIVDTLFNEKVTLLNIQSIKEKLAFASVDDRIIISFSGHGLLDSSFEYYLSSFDIDFKNPSNSGIKYQALLDLLDGIDCRKKLLLLDACHSGEVDKENLVAMQKIPSTEGSGLKGGFVLVDTNYKQLQNRNTFDLMQSLFVNLDKTSGATVIAASAGTQFALEREDIKNGIFTYAILEILLKCPEIKISELKTLVSKKVAELTHGIQMPQTRNEQITIDWRVW